MARRFLFRLFAAAVPAGDHVADSELLRRFVASRDSAAFELLVRRHADAVWAAAIRILGHEADAEDVFQATFLALLRKAGSVRGACIGGWLHRVAVNAALKLKARRTPTVSEGVEPHPVADAPGSPEQVEIASILHQELALLPERYRLPVVLCDLEGQTHAEAAKSLGWPVGSVSGRLSRARDILRDRLTRRGVGPPAVLFTALTASQTAVTAATALAVSTAAVSPAVFSLAEGVLSAMRIARLNLVAMTLATAGLVGLGAAGTVLALTQTHALRTTGEPLPAGAPQPPAKEKPEAKKDEDFTAFPELKPIDPPKERNYVTDKDYAEKQKQLYPRLLGVDPPPAEPGDDTYRKLLKARLNEGRLEHQKNMEMIGSGQFHGVPLSMPFDCLEDMRNVVLELWDRDPKILIPWLEELVIAEKEYERFVSSVVAGGQLGPQKLNAARRHRLEAEAALWKARNAQRQGGK
jgi:RNA polymerase sigma factor (sigma-70 family)